ncbi:MAG: hypothetical protein ABI598_00120 [Chloroflexota bacterium]
MDTAQQIAVGIVVIVAIAIVLLARRVAGILYRTRVAEGFRGDASDLSRRVAQSIGEIAAVIDGVRRRTSDGGAIRDSLRVARGGVDRYIEEVEALEVPASAAVTKRRMIEELERAGRALEMVEHGCDLARDGDRRERGAEADTAIKRGYLNLVHSRESFQELAREAIAEAEEASPVRRFGRPHI